MLRAFPNRTYTLVVLVAFIAVILFGFSDCEKSVVRTMEPSTDPVRRAVQELP